jgi:glycosyl transferase family 87
LAATLAVGRGFINSLHPLRSLDLHMVYSWSTVWFWQGVNPYDPPPGIIENSPWWMMQATYTPYAFAFLSPLVLIPEGWVTLFWSLFNIPLLLVTGLLAFRIFNPDARLKEALLPCLIFFSWVGVRVGLSNGQFSLLVVFFGLLAVAVVDKRPYLGGILLGLSLIKPHVGVAFFLWAVVTGRFKPAAVAVAVTLLGLLVFSLRVGRDPVLVALEYIRVLRGQFGGENYIAGWFELRPLVHLLIPNFSLAETINIAIGLCLLGIIGLIAFSRKLPEGRQRDLVMLQLCCLWSLTSVYHQTYDSILMLPVMFGLYSYIESAPSLDARRQARIALWVLQVELLIQVAGRWRALSQSIDLSAYAWFGTLLSQVDRLLVLCFFIFIAYVTGLSRLLSRRSPELAESAAAA